MDFVILHNILDISDIKTQIFIHQKGEDIHIIKLNISDILCLFHLVKAHCMGKMWSHYTKACIKLKCLYSYSFFITSLHNPKLDTDLCWSQHVGNLNTYCHEI